jgi:retinol dehydrogenase 12
MHQHGYNCLMVYKQSKLCNVLFTHEFNRRMKDTGVRAYAVDPGLVNTDIGKKGTGGFISWFWGMRSKHGVSPYVPAQTITYLCEQGCDFSPKWAYFYNSAEKEPSKPSRDCVGMKRLWEISEQLCGIDKAGVTK